MGIYLNSDNEGFRKAVKSKIYVDKSGLIEYTNECLDTEQRFISEDISNLIIVLTSHLRTGN